MSDSEIDANFAVIANLNGFLDAPAYGLFAALRDLHADPVAPVLEIGVFCGRSLAAIASLYPGRPAIGVDPFFADFANSPSFDDEAEILTSKAGAASPDERQRLFWAAVAQLDALNGSARRSTIALHKVTEAEFTNYNDQRFQLMHIDGEHTYQAVRFSLDHLDSTLMPGGWLVVDDFLHPGFPGISEAVHTHPRFRHDLIPVAYGFNKAVFLWRPAPGLADTMKSALITRYQSAEYVIREMHDGAPVIELREAAVGKERKSIGRRLKHLIGGNR